MGSGNYFLESVNDTDIAGKVQYGERAGSCRAEKCAQMARGEIKCEIRNSKFRTMIGIRSAASSLANNPGNRAATFALRSRTSGLVSRSPSVKSSSAGAGAGATTSSGSDSSSGLQGEKYRVKN